MAHERRKRPRGARSRAGRVERLVGAPPGTLHALEGAGSSSVHVFCFDEASLQEGAGLEALPPRGRGITWVDVIGLGSIELIRAVGEHFGLHALALEDVLHPHQRAKIEEYPESLYIVMRAPSSRVGVLDIEQISMFIGPDFVVTFQEREGDDWEPVRDRLRQAKGRVRRMGASYLGYALLDATVDAMFPLLERYDHRLEAVEDRVFRSPSPELAEEIHDVDRDLMAVRRAVLPMREALVRLVRDEHPLVDADVRIYLRDCIDHLAQMVDMLSGQREVAKALSDGHLTSLGHRSNEVMKVLTIIATIFMPLHFIAGVYGMNFSTEASSWNMPELGWHYGYPFALGLMLTVVLIMLAYFRRQGWF